MMLRCRPTDSSSLRPLLINSAMKALRPPRSPLACQAPQPMRHLTELCNRMCLVIELTHSGLTEGGVNPLAPLHLWGGTHEGALLRSKRGENTLRQVQTPPSRYRRSVALPFPRPPVTSPQQHRRTTSTTASPLILPPQSPPPQSPRRTTSTTARARRRPQLWGMWQTDQPTRYN